jgi:formylglycine-generating enzyme required for sulfatase activity
MIEPMLKLYTETALPNHPFRLHLAPGGTFLMGSTDEDKDADADEKPAHPVELDPFYIAEFPVTQDLWTAVIGGNPSNFQGERRPVEQVSWYDAVAFCNRLNAVKKMPFCYFSDENFKQPYALQGELPNEGPVFYKPAPGAYRLPTEAEWEYAARGGPYWAAENYRYAGSDDLAQVGWFTENNSGETHEVGLLLPNALGLYDMSGNVWEWCVDRFSGEWYAGCAARGTVKNPTGPEQGDTRVDRGGGYFDDAQGCRAAYRDRGGPAYRLDNLGFRLVLSPQSVG